MPESSDGVALSLITAGRVDIGVWMRRAASAVARVGCHFVCRWLQGLPAG